jgi:hypothetical protein
MIRTFALAVALYAYGQPAYYDYRPAMLDKPVQGFHADVNNIASKARRALTTLDAARTMQYLNRYFANVGQQFSSAI